MDSNGRCESPPQLAGSLISHLNLSQLTCGKLQTLCYHPTVLLFCETTECPTECGGNSSCNTLLGLCECDPGYRGYNCSQGNSHLPSLHSASHGFCSLYIVCLPETFGSNCSETCTCEADSNCHHITGDCTCPPGYLGTNCSHGTQ